MSSFGGGNQQPLSPTNHTNKPQQGQQKPTKMRFTSNLATVLNDPNKDRNKVPYLFTKTWGNDFVEATPLGSVNQIHPNYKNFKTAEFQPYLNATHDRHLKHSQHKLELAKSKSTPSQKLLLTRLNELDQIPKVFFDSDFSLSNKETFNSLISLKIFDTNNGATSVAAAISSHQPPNGSVIGGLAKSASASKNKLDEIESRKFILDKLGFYLDIIETQITNQITTKANAFFNAIHSQDEVQEHVLKTCTAVKGLRKNLNFLNDRIVIASIRIIKLINLKIKYRNLIEKLDLMSSVYTTKSNIDMHLDSSEFTGALDLITMSQEILRQDLRGIRALRQYESQFGDTERAIQTSLHDEFTRYIINDLGRDFSLGANLYSEEKLTYVMLGIMRLRATSFVDLCKDEIFIYLKSTVKQTVVEYVAEYDEEALAQNEDESNLRLSDRIRKLKIPEFLHMLSKVLQNLKTMLDRGQSIVRFIVAVIDAAAGVKPDENGSGSDENQIVHTIHLKKELISRSTHQKLVSSLRDLLSSSTDYAQERLVSLLDGKFKANELERLSTHDFVSLSNIIEEFTIEFDQIAHKKTSSLRSWLQNQANKFLHKFHNEKKDKINLALDSESWKSAEVSSDVQNLIDHITRNGLGTPRTYDSKNRTTNDFVHVNSENFVIFGTVIVLIKIMDEYCQFTCDIPNLCYDAMTRLIEIFTIFNSKSYKMILGAGAVELGVLRLITFKTLAITHRSLELVLFFLPILKDFFKKRLNEKQSNTEKQFTKLIGDYNEHLIQLNNKLVFMMDEIFREQLSRYEVIAPVPSHCFRTICSQIDRVYQIVNEIVAEPTLIRLFTDIHDRFKSRLRERLRELNVVNDGGPKHALIFQDMSHYIKQFKNLKGLHLITINFIDVWD